MSGATTTPAAPFLKWAGGKRTIAAQIVALVPPATRTYHEPFVGGGAVFFALRNAGFTGQARLVDLNAELALTYTVVRDHPGELVARLRCHQDAYLGKDAEGRAAYFYAERAREPADDLARAARLIFLNRTAYNGLYRVNASGAFNVPHGRYRQPSICNAPLLRAASVALSGASIESADFEAACALAEPGDFVYLDPPYHPLSPTSRFTNYTREAFGPEEQQRLAAAFADLTRRGVAALLSNSNHPDILALYEGHDYSIETVPMGRAINSKGASRSPIDELLIDNLALVGAGREQAPSPG